jgi:hypothetical protein
LHAINAGYVLAVYIKLCPDIGFACASLCMNTLILRHFFLDAPVDYAQDYHHLYHCYCLCWSPWQTLVVVTQAAAASGKLGAAAGMLAAAGAGAMT